MKIRDSYGRGLRGICSILACGAALMLFDGCVDSEKDLFDAEATKKIYDSSYPVSNIDPEMDWKTTQGVQLNVSVEEEELTKYRVRVYDGYPLSGDSSVKLLAEGNASKGSPFVSKFDCPTNLDGVFVMRTDEHDRNLVKYVSVADGTANVTFGSSVATRAASTRTSAFGSTRSDEVIVPTYSPDKTESEVKALLADAIEFTAETSMEAGQVYYIPAGKSVTRTEGFGVPGAGCTLIVQGTLIADHAWGEVKMQESTKIYVVNGGKINVTEYTNFFFNVASLTVYEGGEVSGYLVTLNGNTKIYNAGVFDVATYTANGGVLYNAESGVITLTLADLNTDGATLVNRGKTTFVSSSYWTKLYNSGDLTVTGGFQGSLYNTGNVEIEYVANQNSQFGASCYMKFNGNFTGDLTIGDNTAVVVDGNFSARWGGSLNLGSNSMLLVNGDANIAGININGPSSGNALVRLNKLTGAMSINSTGNIYYEIKEIDSNLQSAFDGWLSDIYKKLTNDNGTVSNWGESPFTLPAGECTGAGTEPANKGANVEDTPITYTYVFEDNYPYVGDYDFNDIALNVVTTYDRDESTNNVQKIHISVNLAAVGGIKKVGAALRLVGIDKQDVQSVEFGGNTSMRSTLNNSLFETGTFEADDNNLVIPLFGDAHAVYGYTERLILNTGVNDLKETYTMEIVITPTNTSSSVPLITKDNLDFFIGTPYGTGKRAEVHLYEFRKYGATANGDTYEQNLEVAGNKTWAISVPGFRYPREGVVVTKAYPLFEKWAADHESNLDWYKYPIEENTDDYLF
jgi:LruC domain-containing protein